LNPTNSGDEKSGGAANQHSQLSPELQQWENYRPIGLQPGTTIGGVYTIIELLGRGGMGEVYLVRHETLGKKCALKVIPPNKVTDIGWQRFQLEAKAVAKLEHVNLVKVTDLGIHDDSMPFYAMDYIQGSTLEDILLQYGRIPMDKVLEIFIQVSDGLHCAHRNGLLHRDIKPANILVTQTSDNKTLAKVLDFGLVKRTKADRDTQSLTDVGDVFGSPNYMSPEQCRDEKLDERSDMYSLRCTLYECLTGRPPFFSNVPAAIFFAHLESEPPTLASVVGENLFPPALEAVVTKLLHKDPNARYQSLQDLRNDLQTILEGEVAPAFPKTAAVSRPAVRMKSRKSSSSTIAVSLAVIALIPICGYAYWYFQLRPPLSAQKSTAAQTTAVAASAATTASPAASTTSPVAPTTASTASPTATTTAPITEVTTPIETTKADDAFNNFPQHQIVTASLLLTKPFSTDVQENGKWFRVFDFPKDVAIGLLVVPDKGKPFQAIGQCKVPVGDGLVFVPAEITGRYPNCLKRFRPHELAGIKFPPNTDANILKAAGNIKGVVVLDFSLCQGITTESADPLKTLFNIWVLIGSDNNVECLTLSRNGCLEDLKELYLKSTQNLVPLLYDMAHKGKLTKLGIWNKLTKQDIKAIATVKSLNVLDLNNTVVDNEDVALFSTALPNLSELKLQLTKVDAGAIDSLKKIKGLRGFQINSPKLKAGDFEKIKAALPGVNVN